MESQKIIDELKRLVAIPTSIPGGAFYEEFNFKYQPINEYFNSLQARVKPESAASELFRSFIHDIMHIHALGEVNLKGAFIDYVLQQSYGNKVMVELKPFMNYDKIRHIHREEKLDYRNYEDQLKKYLRNKNSEYIILTNIKTAFFFNREAILDFKPFAEMSFPDLLQLYQENENLWDTVRKIEDGLDKPELDVEFFRDLGNWYKELQNVGMIEQNGYSKQELIVLLLNKLIFIKTLEDYGLIEYKFLADEYKNYEDHWKPKGYKKVFTVFFNHIEEFFEEYYDTELFKFNYWNYIDQSLDNVKAFHSAFEKIMGLDSWSMTFGKGLVHYNYRRIDEDVFGKAYETWIAQRRKDSGVYYTPAPITKYMSEKIVKMLFDPLMNEILHAVNKNSNDFRLAEKLMDQLSAIRIIDPASGSGSFLIKVLREIYAQYMRIFDEVKWVVNFPHDGLFSAPPQVQEAYDFMAKYHLEPKDQRKLLSRIMLCHIFAVDKDERALETAKTNIWKEAIKLNPPIYNYRRLNGATDHILPNLELNLIAGDSLIDMDWQKQIPIICGEYKKDIIRLHEIRKKYILNPYDPGDIDEALGIKEKIRERLEGEKSIEEKPVFFCLEFFFCFFDETGNQLPEHLIGFDGVISNPPWEAIKPVKKEFAEMNKYDLDVLQFNNWFENELKTNPDFKEKWKSYQGFYENYGKLLDETYKFQGAGDRNYYKLFIERNIGLINLKGLMNLLVPSGFQTDLGCAGLRIMLFEYHSILEISSFENKGYYSDKNDRYKTKLFPDVHPQFKFSILLASKAKDAHRNSFRAEFYLQHPDDLDDDQYIDYTIDMVRKFSPENLSIMEFRSMKDYELCSKILGSNILFKDTGLKFRREFDMTNDSRLFHTAEQIKGRESEYLRLWEGKMIHQYNSGFGEAKYFLNEQEASLILFDKEIHRIKRRFGLNEKDLEKIKDYKISLDYLDYRFVYRAIGSSTNERSLIASIIPKCVYIGHSMNHLVRYENIFENGNIIPIKVSDLDIIKLMVLFNSLVLNYFMRNKISANLTMNYINELPIAEVLENIETELIRKAYSLLYRKSNAADFEELGSELGIEPDFDRSLVDLRAEIEVTVARDLYSLGRDDWDYLCSTFTFGADSATKQELDEIIARSKELWQ